MNTRDFEAVAAFGIDVLPPGALVAKLEAMEAQVSNHPLHLPEGLMDQSGDLAQAEVSVHADR